MTRATSSTQLSNTSATEAAASPPIADGSLRSSRSVSARDLISTPLDDTIPLDGTIPLDVGPSPQNSTLLPSSTSPLPLPLSPKYEGNKALSTKDLVDENSINSMNSSNPISSLLPLGQSLEVSHSFDTHITNEADISINNNYKNLNNTTTNNASNLIPPPPPTIFHPADSFNYSSQSNNCNSSNNPNTIISITITSAPDTSTNELKTSTGIEPLNMANETIQVNGEFENSNDNTASVNNITDQESAKLQNEPHTDKRRSKIAKTGNFYLKHATRPMGIRVPSMITTSCDFPNTDFGTGEGALFGEILEQLISAYSPKGSPTDNTRLRPHSFGMPDIN